MPNDSTLGESGFSDSSNQESPTTESDALKIKEEVDKYPSTKDLKGHPELKEIDYIKRRSQRIL